MGSSDTIFASATGNAATAIGIVRISGSLVDEICTRVLACKPPASRRFTLVDMRDPEDGRLVDRLGILRFSGPASYTGEDVLEIHHHGSPAISRFIKDRLASVPGVRAAERGEFTRRALWNGKMNAFEAEAVAETVAAESLGQAKLAATSNKVEVRLNAWAVELDRLLAEAEAEIDFGDEEDVPVGLSGERSRNLIELGDEMSRWLDSCRRAREAERGRLVVVYGAPNVGKSSLINALARREVSIVTDEPGTTRDAIEVKLDLGGRLVTFVDTAGLREAEGQAEEIGIVRTFERLEQADLKLHVSDCISQLQVWSDESELRVLSKADLRTNHDWQDFQGVATSAKSGKGLDELLRRVSERLEMPNDEFTDDGMLNERQLAALGETVIEVRAGASAKTLDVHAENLRRARTALGRIVGRLDCEELLDQIFGRFCIGK